MRTKYLWVNLSKEATLNFVSDSRILSSDAAAFTKLPAKKLLTRTALWQMSFDLKVTNRGSYRRLHKVITYKFSVNMIGQYTSVHTQCGKRLVLTFIELTNFSLRMKASSMMLSSCSLKSNRSCTILLSFSGSNTMLAPCFWCGKKE